MKKRELRVFTTSDFENSEDFVIVHDVETNAIIYRNPAMAEMLSGERPLFSTSVLDLTAERAVFEGKEVVIEISKRLRRTILGVNEVAHQDLTTQLTFAVKNLTKNDFINIDPKTGFANYQKVLASMIRLIGNYYESPVAQLLVIKSHVNHPFFIHLPLNGKDKAYSKEVVIQDYWWSGFEAYFGHGYALLSQDMLGFKAFDEHLYNAIIANGVHSILMIPIIVEGEMIGVISFGNASNKRDDIFFIGRLLGEQIGTIISRAESFHDLYFDDLTGLPLGEYLEANFTATLHSFGKRPGTLIRLDFLKFRLYNSHYGIQAGDALLKTVAEEIRKLSSKVFIARASHSDVFYVLTPDVPATAQRYCDKLLKIIRGRYPGVNIDMAFGLYQISSHDEPFKIADARASFANKVAKANPLSPICIYDDAMEHREAYDLELTSAFNDAIKNNEFELWLQPKYDLEQETYIGGEAFVRYIYDEIAYRVFKKVADTLIGKIAALPQTATATKPAAAKITGAPAIGLVADAIGNLSDEATAPVVVMNKLTWAAFKQAQYAAGYNVDPFEGFAVHFNNSLPAYSTASSGAVYAIVGDFRQGALANYPNGDTIEFTFDTLTRKKENLVEVLGELMVAAEPVANKAFTLIAKA